jgi:hypothetical protein
MNDHHPHRTGLSCRLLRRWEMGMGPASGQSALTSRHMSQCEACREFFSEDLVFEQSLRRAAPRMKVEPEAGMNLRILQAVMETRPARRPVVSRRLGFSLVAAVAGVALAFVVLQRSMVTESENPEIAGVENSGKESGGLTTPADEDNWWMTFDARRSALAIAEKNPLQQEIDSVYTDAQAMIGFLALNFLPSETTTPERSVPTQG